ncbi:MAG: sugar ABC transporter permease [Candidatus Kapabacteria bacterium]|nr:sugar ABC transporter permease [Candidatus Kapabacteria bacterium]MDW7996615.1 sugar ABC transporter permease [Bacteroidota bacterium]MDW8224633.1 sugar ABC transporter permease [Bacteroidota bacterium]
MSMTEYHTLRGPQHYVGIGNYSSVFADGLFWKALGNTALFTLGTVPITIALSLVLAMLVESRMVRWRALWHSTLLLPSVTSLVVLALIFSNLYARNGYVNAILASLGLPYPARGWLQEPTTALPAIMLLDIWASVGYYTLLLVAGLQAIPREYEDVALLAGASFWQRLRWVTLPLLRPMLTFALVLNTIKALQVFVEVYVMTRGGPLGATTTLVYLVFVNAFEYVDRMGYAAALAYVTFALIGLLAVVQLRLMRRQRWSWSNSSAP